MKFQTILGWNCWDILECLFLHTQFLHNVKFLEKIAFAIVPFCPQIWIIHPTYVPGEWPPSLLSENHKDKKWRGK